MTDTDTPAPAPTESKAMMEEAKDHVTLDELMLRQPPWPPEAYVELVEIHRRTRARFNLSERTKKRKGS